MNPSSDLQALMALDALGEATPEQQAELQRHLAADPGLARESAAMRDLTGRVEDLAAPLPPPIAVPASVLSRLEEARSRALANATAAQGRAAGAQNVVVFSDAGSARTGGQAVAKTQVRRSSKVVQMLAWAAVIALFAAPVGWWLSQRGGDTLATAGPALAPQGETGMTQPTLVWENAPGQDYNVWILPEGADQKTTPALFVANGVRSPVTFDKLKPGPGHDDKSAKALKPGTPYLALVCLVGGGRTAGVTVPFRTAPAALGSPPAPSDPATALALARQLRDAGRTSDALMVMAQLPDSVRGKPEIASMEAELRKALEKPRVP